MRSSTQFKTGQTYQQRLIDRQQSREIVRLRGTPKTPSAPRDIFSQPASRGVLLTWKLPEVNDDIVGWRVYKDSESSLHIDIKDKGVRQAFVSLSSGATPPKTALFVCSVNAVGKESPKVQIAVSATAETGAPTVPSVPPGYTQEAAGGADRRQYYFTPQ